MESSVERQDWRAVTARFTAACANGGLDLVQPFAAAQYNAAVDETLHLPDFGRAAALAVVVGNTRGIWAHFVAALRARRVLPESANPFDDYVRSAIETALSIGLPEHEVRWANRVGPGMVAMQRAAAIAGLAATSPAYLSVHPIYGPWIGLRAVVVFDSDAPSESPPPARLPCDDCEATCVPALSAALGAQGDRGAWRRWLAVRDACPVGREHRYGDDQIAYHYTKDRAVLQRLIAE